MVILDAKSKSEISTTGRLDAILTGPIEEMLSACDGFLDRERALMFQGEPSPEEVKGHRLALKLLLTMMRLIP